MTPPKSHSTSSKGASTASVELGAPRGVAAKQLQSLVASFTTVPPAAGPYDGVLHHTMPRRHTFRTLAGVMAVRGAYAPPMCLGIALSTCVMGEVKTVASGKANQ